VGKVQVLADHSSFPKGPEVLLPALFFFLLAIFVTNDRIVSASGIGVG
jgi:hypothetical protein